MGRPHFLDDQRLEEIVGNILRIGVLLAGSVVVLGAMVYLFRHGTEPPVYHAFKGEPSDLRSFDGIIRQTLAIRGRGIIQLGLLLLIATPVVRVAFSLVAFALQRDRVYVLVTLVVLAVLLYGFIGGGV